MTYIPLKQFPTTNDSIYSIDIDVDNSDNGGFSGVVTDYFDSLTSVNSDASATNPKVITLRFERSIQTSSIGLGCNDPTKNFSNVKIKLLGSADEIRQTFDVSTNNTKYNSLVPEFIPDTANGMIIEFHTADEVGLSNLILYKSTNVNSRISAISELTNTVENIESFRGALKVTDGFVHRAIVNEYFIRDVGPTTTLTVQSTVGDTSITVADSTGFVTTDLIKIGTTICCTINALQDKSGRKNRVSDALSRRQHGFESRWGRQFRYPLVPDLGFAQALRERLLK